MNIEHRPWGYFTILSEMPDHKVKRIVVYPGKRLSLQRHAYREEHWFVIAGRGIVTINGIDVQVVDGKSIDIPRRGIHRISNVDGSDLVFIEIQTGDYFGEDDIERIEDDYGRQAC